MRLFSGLIASAAVLACLGGGLAPTARADEIVAGHYETRTVAQTDPGTWVDEQRTVTTPGYWQEFDRVECVVPGHYEARTQTVELPGHNEKVWSEWTNAKGHPKSGWTDQWVGGGCETRTVQVWVPEVTRTVRDRRWVPPCTHVETVRVFRPGCTHEVAVQVWVPERVEVCTPPVGVELRIPDRIGFTIGGGRSRVRVSLGLGGRCD
jgi:hypothetical protein